MARSVHEKTDLASSRKSSKISYLEEKWPMMSLFTPAKFAIAAACTVVE
jgi:hypothetical protein